MARISDEKEFARLGWHHLKGLFTRPRTCVSLYSHMCLVASVFLSRFTCLINGSTAN